MKSSLGLTINPKVKIVQDMISRNYHILRKEGFNLYSYDTRVINDSYSYDHEVAERFKRLNPVSYEILNHKYFQDYIMWFKINNMIKERINS